MAEDVVNGQISRTDVVKCSACGADMIFDVESGKLKCPYCGTSDDVEANAFENERDFNSFDESLISKEEGTVTYRCPNCHAETVMREFGASAKCPFCGATNIIALEDMPGLKPDAILPFKVTKDEASARSKKWVRGKLFAPSSLKKIFAPDKMEPVYQPAFSFDSDTVSRYDGRLGEDYTVTVGTGKNRRTETRTRWYYVHGNHLKNFTNVVIEASPHLDQKQMDKIGPFDIFNSVEYNKEFLAGFMAERHDISVNDGFAVAKNKMDAEIRSEIIAQYNADRVDYLNVDTKHTSTAFKNMLLPVYCCTFKFKSKVYNYFVNGRTGRVNGKTPLSPWKVGIAVVIGIALLFGIYKILTGN